MIYKAALVMLIAVSFASTSVFAESMIEVNISSNEIKALDTILVTGTITDVSQFKPVQITVTDPNGMIVYSPQVPIEEGSEFTKLIHPTLPSFEEGTYTITVSHEDTEVTEIVQFVVTSQQIPRNEVNQELENTMILKESSSGKNITIIADAIEGSDTINISGITKILGSDVTIIVSSPNGNVVTIAQITPGLNGDFETEIKIGGSLWKEDGVYTITANQGTASEYKESINVEIQEGVVVPEFGVVASLVLMISIIAIVAVSAKSRLSILPRY